MTYQYEIVRELKSHTKVSRHIYLFDFFTILGAFGVSLILEPAVHPSLSFAFFAYAVAVGFLLSRTIKRKNPGKRLFQAAAMALRRKKDSLQFCDVFLPIPVPATKIRVQDRREHNI